MIGESLGHYRIERRLGAGGMGMVYAAADERLGRTVAIKVIHEGLEDPGLRERFWREARAAAAITHPAICQVHEVGEDGGQLYIVMELLDGQTLEDRLLYGPVDVQEALRVGLSVLDALAMLHRRGMVHRDIKPSNVFLLSDGRIKLLDFGLVRPTGPATPAGAADETALTRPGMGVGTPGYMSPEQVLGKEVDARTDLFSVAVVLHEAVTGRRPFKGQNAIEIMNAVLKEKLPPLRGSSTHEQLGQILSRAAAREPADRFATAEDMASALRAISQGSRVDRAPVAATALVRLAVVPFRMLRQDPERDFLSPSLADAVSLSLTGIGSLVVRSTAASARYAGATPDLDAIQKNLDVDVVLMGTLLTAGDRCRVTAQLIEVPSGDVAWSETIDVSSKDIFELQDTLTKKIVDSLKLPLTKREREGLDRDVPASPSGYEMFLKANQLARPEADPPQARDLYVRALESDPHYAPAWAQLAICYRLIAKYYPQDRKRNYVRSEEALRRAFELRPDFPVASLAKAHLDLDMGRTEQAVEDLLGVVEKNPNDPAGFAGLVAALRYAGFLDASVAAHRRVRALDPEMRTSVEMTYMIQGDPEAAAQESTEPLLTGAFAQLAMGDREAATRLLRMDLKPSRRPLRRAFMAMIRAAIERDHETLSRLSEVLESTPDAEATLLGAMLLTVAGDEKQAVDWVERGIEGGCFVPEIFRTTLFEPLQDDARFRELVSRAEARHRDVAERFGERIGRIRQLEPARA